MGRILCLDDSLCVSNDIYAEVAGARMGLLVDTIDNNS